MIFCFLFSASETSSGRASLTNSIKALPSDFILSSTKLRTLSPSAENKKNLEKPDFSEYQNVSISRIESVGNYAIRIVFDDGHNTGIYSWEYLHEIGSKF